MAKQEKTINYNGEWIIPDRATRRLQNFIHKAPASQRYGVVNAVSEAQKTLLKVRWQAVLQDRRKTEEQS